MQPQPMCVNQAYNGVARSNLSNATKWCALEAEALSQIKCNPRNVDYKTKIRRDVLERTPAFAYATSRHL